MAEAARPVKGSGRAFPGVKNGLKQGVNREVGMNKTQIMVVLTALAVLVVGIALISGHGVHRPGAGSDVPLVNTYWALTEIGGNPFKMPEGMGREPHMVLQMEDSRVAGYSGCNRLMGRYALEGEGLTFPDGIATTRMACVVGMDTEKAFADVLQRSSGWNIEGDTLTLSDEDGTALARFEQRLME